ncbi:MAG TPA: NADH-quinone oxidoreductase subunit NuoH [Nitrospiria bacterium]|jgi:NADH-quinone oxidoreductase subunit H|nr:NADH-quinone oxidoreductase subunit NuoH [Nitrospiria bacterium]
MVNIALNLIVVLVTIGVVMVTVLLHVAYLTYFERKILGWMQDRMGPMEVGYHGLLQPIADGLKLFFKEDIVPAQANKIIFTLAPILVLVPALIGFAVIPFGRDTISIFGLTFRPFVTDINIGILYILAFASIGAYGVLLGGWASNNKYSLLGGLRSAAQVISYELSLGLAIVGVLLMAGSLSLVKITEAQGGGLLHWFILPQFVAFVIYLISAIAETNRLPFDLPEAESELVAGFFTEYSGMRFAFFFLAEYANMILVSCIATILFLGGWHAPFEALGFIPPILWFVIKVYFFLFFYIWIRGTLPRLRYDQLMMFGWKVMIPLALANILVTSTVLYFVRG